MASRGALIAIEGCDRSGKSTQAALLVQRLRDAGVPTELVKFPDRTTVIGKIIDRHLKGDAELDDHSIHLLFSANRWGFKAWMERQQRAGVTLVLDRYVHSGLAYSMARGLDVEWCRATDIGLPHPDLVIYLDAPPTVAAGRSGYGAELYENVELQQRVYNAFAELQDASWVVLDASLPPENVAKDVLVAAQRCVSLP
ncbi:thymidylate kinase-like protein [Polychytrium aggregatum]|uniref:thymidylate kinase-like protein n=1 Tax=Polychytrium aggregatum TaxID=110093 RepID=UPI0022FDD9CF|nr:thymidylate kinase-like protein [Polychytrium aggregatum]KAI9190563.1 thymidylate kinase-like protein [Polychytrium aggregatum]